MKHKHLFIDRDGTIIKEPADYQIDSLEKLDFFPGVISALSTIVNQMDYQLVMVSNQDGLGRECYPLESFDIPQRKMLSTLEGEGICFKDILIDTSLPEEKSPNRKPRTGLVTPYMNSQYVDMENSYVIGDRITDMALANNMGCKGIWLCNDPNLGTKELSDNEQIIQSIALKTDSWSEIVDLLRGNARKAHIHRHTNETDIDITLDLSRSGKYSFDTGLAFFDHMLEQIARHGYIKLSITAQGDLQVDEHHTIEDVGIALGTAFTDALGSKKGISRYGFALPMDESSANVLIDFSARPYLVWDVEFSDQRTGDISNDMWKHFFASFAVSAGVNLHISATGKNSHHKIEAVFKAFARAISMAVKQTDCSFSLPSSKGTL